MWLTLSLRPTRARSCVKCVFRSPTQTYSFIRDKPLPCVCTCKSSTSCSLVPPGFRLFKCTAAEFRQPTQNTPTVNTTSDEKRPSLESFCRSYHFEKITVTSLCISPSLTLKLLSFEYSRGETEHRVFDLQGKTRRADGLQWRSWRLLDRMGADEAELSQAVWTRPLWSPWCRRWWGWAGIGAEAPVDLL